MIGHTNYLGKGYGAKTLIAFLDYFRQAFDAKADTFLIDPASDNPRAKHVYKKAGFDYVGDFVMTGDCSGSGKPHHLLVKRFSPTMVLTQAKMDQYPVIQNMARFYVYDLSSECGGISSAWQLPSDGLYESFDFKCYFEEETRLAYLINVHDEIAGFILLNQATVDKRTDWNMGEFFILAKFQRQGIGQQAVDQLWALHPGQWEVAVLPENRRALAFWQWVISGYTKGNFHRKTTVIHFDNDQPRRVIFTFDTHNYLC